MEKSGLKNIGEVSQFNTDLNSRKGIDRLDTKTCQEFQLSLQSVAKDEQNQIILGNFYQKEMIKIIQQGNRLQ